MPCSCHCSSVWNTVFLIICYMISLNTENVVVCGQSNDPICKWGGSSDEFGIRGNDVLFDDQQNGFMGDGKDDKLECHVRTIVNADNVFINLTSSQMDHIFSFGLICSDVIFFESNLEKNFLTQLRRLQQLKLEYCKIRNIPRAVLSQSRELKQLTLRTHNRDWSAMSMTFHPESFLGLPQLKWLDLSDNNIWYLPKELFCPLTTLAYLNLSSNRLQNVDLGFSDWGNGPSAPGKSCAIQLETLDLSNNEVQSLPDNAFTGLRALQKLFLQNNKINQIPDRPFRGLVALKFVNMSNNVLTQLPPELFQSTRDLKEAHLSNNSIAILAPNLLAGLDQLVILDFSRNELDNAWVNKDTFSGLIRLVVLNLAYNRLTKLDSSVFQDLYSLQILDLEHNQIESIADKAFSTLSNLHALKLSHNKLANIGENHFSGVYALNQLFMDNNRISTIGERTFENSSNLHDLGLYGNRLKSVPEALKHLHYLKTIDLGGNEITHIANSSFQGLSQLKTLIMSENKLTNVTQNVFATLPMLEVLNLGSNRIHKVDKMAFGSNSYLQAIRLDANLLDKIDDTFTTLKNLVWLNISDNSIRQFDYAFIPPKVQWLDMHKNNIENLEWKYQEVDRHGEVGGQSIKMLDVSFNQLEEINDLSIPESVELLFLNNNRIGRVKANTFLRRPNLSRVVLVGNQIKLLDMPSLRIDPVPENRELPQFYISENPFVCDCSMEWLQRVNQLSNQRWYPKVMDIDSVQCHVIHGRGQGVKYLMELRSHQFLCPYESHCFSVCSCCEYDACDCKMTCPNNCSCYHDHSWATNIVDCSDAGYTQIPPRIPMDATEIYLDGNDLGRLESHVFIGKKKLQILYLNDSNVSTIRNKTFNGVDNLRVLHLENNELSVLQGYEFQSMDKLTELYLENNSISEVAEDSFASMKKLEVLRLEHNKLDSFRALRQIKSSSLSTVTLAENVWTCDCANIAELWHWMKETNSIVTMNDVMCVDTTTMTVEDALKSCSPEGSVSGSDSNNGVDNAESSGFGSGAGTSSNGDYLPFVAAALVALIVIILVVIVLIIFADDIGFWFYCKFGMRLRRPAAGGRNAEDDADRLFDAYLIYSIKDDEFVSKSIASPLARQGYELCLHYRDAHVSPPYLADSLIGAADASRRIIIVLSLSFLQNEWESPLFRSALKHMLERNSRGRRVISVITSNNCILSPNIQDILGSSQLIRWDDKRFWPRLRYLLPDCCVKRKQGAAAAHRMAGGAADSKKITINCDAMAPGCGAAAMGVNAPPAHPGAKVLFGQSVAARYTTAPTSVDSWYKMSPAVSLTQSSGPTLTQSSCVSDESSQRTNTDDDDDGSHQHSYMTIDYQQRNNKVLHHVYSSIPDPIYNTANGRTYFV